MVEREALKRVWLAENNTKKMETKLQNAKNGIRRYKELLEWVKAQLHKDMKYIPLVKYTKRHFVQK